MYSEDRKLLSVLSSALGPEFQVSLEPSEDEVSQLLSSGSWDVVILDLDSNQSSLKQTIASCRRIVALQGSSVVMADDSLRGAAEELVRLGAYSY
ncbi:MAG: sigma-54-dependent Fis family transcriptional regulator, partial [Silvibacterium sp.]